MSRNLIKSGRIVAMAVLLIVILAIFLVRLYRGRWLSEKTR